MSALLPRAIFRAAECAARVCEAGADAHRCEDLKYAARGAVRQSVAGWPTA